MDNKLDQLLSLFYHSTEIPVSYYTRQGCMRSYVPLVFQPDLAFCILENAIEKRIADVGFSFHSGAFFGYVMLNESEYLLLGPVSSQAVTQTQCKALLQEMNISLGKTKKLEYFLTKIPVINRSRFICTLRLLHCLLGNSENGQMEDISGEEVIRQSIDISLKEKDDSWLEYHDTEEVEKKVFSVISHGKTRELLKIMKSLTNAALHPEKSAESSLRLTKNSFVTAAAISSRIAVQAGLNYDLSLSVSDYYIQKMESLSHIEEVISLLEQMMLDYCERIRKLRTFHDAGYITLKIIDYVDRNIYDSCRLEDISKELNLSASHLSATFKRDTHISLKQYIQTEKVEEAKYLLENPELTISDIAVKLNYSSASHFQTAFKKISGMTPKEYRLHHVI